MFNNASSSHHTTAQSNPTTHSAGIGTTVTRTPLLENSHALISANVGSRERKADVVNSSAQTMIPFPWNCQNYSPVSELVAGDALKGSDDKSLIPGSTVQVASGAFAGFSGILKKVDCKEGLATVGFSLFGKETLADIDVNEIVAEVG